MNRTTAIVITVAIVLLCACPGLFSLLMGGMFAVISFMPGADINVMGSSDPQSALNFGIGGICGGAIFLVVAIAVLFFVWRRPANAVR